MGGIGRVILIVLVCFKFCIFNMKILLIVSIPQVNSASYLLDKHKKQWNFILRTKPYEVMSLFVIGLKTIFYKPNNGDPMMLLIEVILFTSLVSFLYELPNCYYLLT